MQATGLDAGKVYCRKDGDQSLWSLPLSEQLCTQRHAFHCGSAMPHVNKEVELNNQANASRRHSAFVDI